MEMNPGDSQQSRYQQNIEFLRSQHQELVGNLHEEVERLKRKNRGLVLRALFFQYVSFCCRHSSVVKSE